MSAKKVDNKSSHTVNTSSSPLSGQVDLLLLLSIIKSFSGSIYWKNKEGKYLGCNDTMLEMAGMKSIIGKTDLDMPWAKSAHTVRENELTVMAHNSALELEETRTIANGEQIIVLTRITSLLDEHESIIGTIGTSTNITHHKQKESELSLTQEKTQSTLENIVANMPGHVYWKDKNGVYLGCNNRQARSIGFQYGYEIIGKTDFDLPWGGNNGELFRKNDRHIMKTGKAEIIEEKSQVDGNNAIVLSHKSPMRNKQGEITGLLGISIDITDRKKIEAELHFAKEQAEAASLAKTDFIANMSHDIRTPLTGVIGLSEILEHTLQNPEQKENAHLLHDSGEELLNLLNGILDDIRAEHTSETDICENSFDLHRCVENLVRLELPTTKLKHLGLHVDIDANVPQYIVSDRKKIHRILLNLLGNAIKFTQTGSITIQVKCLDSNKSGTHLQFGVSDTGIGIPKELQDKVFDRFFRVTSSYKRHYKGHGLGLHIAQSYVSLLGGHITLTSEEGVGSTFYFDLQCKKGKGEKIKPESIDTASNKHVPVSKVKPSTPPLKELDATDLNSTTPHLLLVEDNETALKVLESIVSSAGYRFTSASDGEKALELAKSMKFNLVITDIGLPGISGNELTQLIRDWEKEQNKPSIPVLGLTGHAKETAKTECLASGMNDVFSKPTSLAMIKQMVKQYVLSIDLEKPADQTKECTNLSGAFGVDLPSTEDELFQLEHFPLFDIQYAQEQVGDLSVLVQIIKGALSDQAQNDIKKMEHAYIQKDWSQIEKLAHKIKGGTVYIGTRRFQYACQYLERYFKAGHRSQLDKLYHQLLSINLETNKTLEEWLIKFKS